MPVVLYPLGGSAATRLREALVDRWSRRPPRRLLWWTVQLRNLPQRLLGPVPTDWFVVPLALGAFYSLCYCLGWGYSWWVVHSGHHPLVQWDDQFHTWYRDTKYVRMMRRVNGVQGMLWDVVNRPHRRRLHTPWWEPKLFRGYNYKRRTFGRVAAIQVPEFRHRKGVLQNFYMVPFFMLGPQLLSLVAYGRELRRLRLWHSWAFPSYDFHWEVDTVRTWVRTMGLLSLVLVPAHLLMLLWNA